ncbi:MAG: hypothetical protein AB7I36_15710 [Rhodospirillaceae bacterium]
MQLVGKVRAMIAAGQSREAAALCEQKLDQLPASAEAGLLSGLMLTIKGRHNDAIAAYDMALSFAPDALYAYIGMAENLAEKGWLNSAVVVLEDARATASFTDEAQTLLETLHARLTHLQQAARGRSA